MAKVKKGTKKATAAKEHWLIRAARTLEDTNDLGVQAGKRLRKLDVDVAELAGVLGGYNDPVGLVKVARRIIRQVQG